MAQTKHVYRFGSDAQGRDVTEGASKMNFILGGKGANLAEMARMGLPVPPGFTVTCQTCVQYSSMGNTWTPEALKEIEKAWCDLEDRMGKKLGDDEDPLLVSVRSGAPFSMPGMMDTILNLGLNDTSVEGLIRQTQNPRFCWDSYRRFVQIFSHVVMGIDSDFFEDALRNMKARCNAASDTDFSADNLKELVKEFKEIFAAHVDTHAHPDIVCQGSVVFPDNPYTQLRLAIEAVFGSWNNERAILYRKRNKISDDLGTAVNVQVMVYGNKGDTSATGVAFTRNPATGDKEYYGDFLVNAQGEDVVAGTRNTQPIAELKTMPALEQAGEELEEIFVELEHHYRDMMDIEFTIEQSKLWMLQARVGKRTAQSALKCAIDMEAEGLISKETAVSRVRPEQFDQLLHPQLDPNAQFDVLATGLNASPGAAVGGVVFSSADAVLWAERGEPCILVRWETNPDDLKGMVVAEGILTSHGGKTSHAAVIARGMGMPCVCGVEALVIDAAKKQARVKGSDVVLHEGDLITIDGTTGRVVLGAVDLVRPELTGDFETILDWADEIRNDPTYGRVIGVHANADNPSDAKRAREFGAEGIGLCRTEHMFLGDRKCIIQDYILTHGDEVKKRLLAQLLKVQTEDFLGMFEAMDSRTVIVRLLDPPLHEFLDSARELAIEITRLEDAGASQEELTKKRSVLEAIDSISESNPMLGLRGCRLGIVYPELTSMQVRAIATATAELKKRKLFPMPEIMIPLVSVAEELAHLRERIEADIAEVSKEYGVKLTIPIGTMIELPRAALDAQRIAKYADFFSFGTNDLTQTTFGFSRDDVESAFIPAYLMEKILAVNPFETIDDCVCQLVKMGIEGGRSVNPRLSMGVCGEHGGDPDSIFKLYGLGLDYVSCSPYRVPVARLTACQAKLTVSNRAEQQDL